MNNGAAEGVKNADPQPSSASRRTSSESRRSSRASQISETSDDQGFSKLGAFLIVGALGSFAIIGFAISNHKKSTENTEDSNTVDSKAPGSVNWVIPDFDVSRSVDHVKNCPTAPDSRTAAIGAVEYDYKTANQDESYMHVTYADGRTVRMTNYEKFKKYREKRNVHVREERIIGGQPVDIKAFPFFASLHSKQYDQHMCGGSIISLSWILTAAHCFDSLPNPNQWLIHAGISGNSEISTGNQFHHQSDVHSILIHSNWNEWTFEADVALMRLMTPINSWTEYIQPHCIPTAQNGGPITRAGHELTVVGFGYTDEATHSPSTVLRGVNLFQFENSDCNEMFNADWVKSDMMCAGVLEGGKDACQGDSGGPLSYQVTMDDNTDLWWLKGVVSFGVGCGRENLGGVYASVDYYSDWIFSAMAHYDQHLK